ncbi:unnamed protein product, partial [Ectocarpus sp. 13 AM-2016]
SPFIADYLHRALLRGDSMTTHFIKTIWNRRTSPKMFYAPTKFAAFHSMKSRKKYNGTRTGKSLSKHDNRARNNQTTAETGNNRINGRSPPSNRNKRESRPLPLGTRCQTTATW